MSKYTVALQNPLYCDRDGLIGVARKVVFRTTSRRKAKKYVNTLIRKGYDAYDISAPSLRRHRKVRPVRVTASNDIPF